jgi:SAM-dependent methyltransferase
MEKKSHFYEGRDLETLEGMPNYYNWIMGLFNPYLSRRVIEYGAGRGTISALLVPQVDDLELIEPSPNLIECLEDRFSNVKYVTIINQSIEEHTGGKDDNAIETIIMVNVLEHVEDDAQAVKELFRILQPGGHLCIYVPAMDWLFSDLDHQVGHFRRYHKPTLSNIITGAGFDIKTVRYLDLIGAFSWWLLHRVMKRTSFGSPVISTIYDRVFVPINRLIESIIPLPFGKNILLVAKKP